MSIPRIRSLGNNKQGGLSTWPNYVGILQYSECRQDRHRRPSKMCPNNLVRELGLHEVETFRGARTVHEK